MNVIVIIIFHANATDKVRRLIVPKPNWGEMSLTGAGHSVRAMPQAPASLPSCPLYQTRWHGTGATFTELVHGGSLRSN